MELKHTPGPWHVANGVQIRSAKHQIAKIWMMRNGEGNHNARLIAAAPELLEALQQAVAYIDGEKTPINALANARLIIAKATGQQP